MDGQIQTARSRRNPLVFVVGIVVLFLVIGGLFLILRGQPLVSPLSETENGSNNVRIIFVTPQPSLLTSPSPLASSSASPQSTPKVTPRVSPKATPVQSPKTTPRPSASTTARPSGSPSSSPS